MAIIYRSDYNIGDLSWLDGIISGVDIPLYSDMKGMIKYCVSHFIKNEMGYDDNKPSIIDILYLPFVEEIVRNYQIEAHHDCPYLNFEVFETTFKDIEKYFYKKMKKQNIPYKRFEYDKLKNCKFLSKFNYFHSWSFNEFLDIASYYLSVISIICEEFRIDIPDMTSKTIAEIYEMIISCFETPEELHPINERDIGVCPPEYILILLLIAYAIRSNIFLQFSYIKAYLIDLNEKEYGKILIGPEDDPEDSPEIVEIKKIISTMQPNDILKLSKWLDKIAYRLSGKEYSDKIKRIFHELSKFSR